MQEGHSHAHVGDGAVLKARLHNAVVFSGCFNELAPFEYVMRGGLFYIHVLAGLNGPNSPQGMPVIRRCYGNKIQFFVFQQLAYIDLCSRFSALQFLDLVHPFGKKILIDIAEGFYTYIMRFGHPGPDAEVVHALAAYTDHAEVDAVVGSNHRSVALCAHAERRCAQSNTRSTQGCFFNECPSGFFHAFI